MNNKNLEDIFNKIKSTPPSVSLEEVKSMVETNELKWYKKKLFIYSLNSVILLLMVVGGILFATDNKKEINSVKKISLNTPQEIISPKKTSNSTEKVDSTIVEATNTTYETTPKISSKTEEKGVDNNQQSAHVDTIPKTNIIDETSKLKIDDKLKKADITRTTVKNEEVKEIDNNYQFIITQNFNKKRVEETLKELRNEGINISIDKEKYNSDGYIEKLKGKVNSNNQFEANDFDKIIFLIESSQNRCQVKVIEKRKIYTAKRDKDRTDKKYHVDAQSKKTKKRKRGSHWTSEK